MLKMSTLCQYHITDSILNEPENEIIEIERGEEKKRE